MRTHASSMCFRPPLRRSVAIRLFRIARIPAITAVTVAFAAERRAAVSSRLRTAIRASIRSPDFFGFKGGPSLENDLQPDRSLGRLRAEKVELAVRRILTRSSP